MATSRVLLVVGAGTAGTLALRNPKVAELLNDLSQVECSSCHDRRHLVPVYFCLVSDRV